GGVEAGGGGGGVGCRAAGAVRRRLRAAAQGGGSGRRLCRLAGTIASAYCPSYWRTRASAVFWWQSARCRRRTCCGDGLAHCARALACLLLPCGRPPTPLCAFLIARSAAPQSRGV